MTSVCTLPFLSSNVSRLLILFRIGIDHGSGNFFEVVVFTFLCFSVDANFDGLQSSFSFDISSSIVGEHES